MTPDPTPSPTPRKFTQLEELDIARREVTRMRGVAEDAHQKYMAAELERRELESALDYMQASASKGLAVIEAAQRLAYRMRSLVPGPGQPSVSPTSHLSGAVNGVTELDALCAAIDAWEASDD